MTGLDLTGPGRVVFVTGGASGLGLAASQVFGEAGYRVAMIDVDVPGGTAAQEQLKAQGVEAFFVEADVSKALAVEAAVRAVLERWGRLDCVINNAGILGRCAPIQDLEEDDLECVLGVNLKGPFLVCKHAVRVQKGQGGGVILNVASIAAEAGAAFYPPYSSAKAGLVALTRSIARNVGRFNIRVNCLSPGSIVDTNLQPASGPSPSAEQKRAERGALLRQIPLGRAARARQIANVALFLASPLADHIHGAVLTVDGGESLGYQ